MAFNDEGVEQRLSSLSETHDSISTTAQWLIFHRRHADRIVQLWMKRLADSSSSRRLNLIYLANDVAQKSKSRSRDEFVSAFASVMPDAIELAYKAAPQNIRGKLVHVVGVWRERNIFEQAVQIGIEARIAELDRIRNGSQTAVFGAFGGEVVPQKLRSVVTAFQTVEKQTAGAESANTSATQSYDKFMDPSNPQLAPPVFAARLNGLLNTLAQSQTTVAGYVKSRRELVSELESLLSTHKSQLAEDEAKLDQLEQRRREIEKKKQDVEMEIMRGLGPVDDDGAQEQNRRVGGNGCAQTFGSPVTGQDLEAPEMEALTPTSTRDEDDDLFQGMETGEPDAGDGRASSQPAKKRRRMELTSDDDFPDLGQDDGIDADVAAMLGSS